MIRALPCLAMGLLLVGAPVDADDGSPAPSAWQDVYAPASPPALDAETWTRLEAGEVRVDALPPSGGEGLGVRVMGLVDAPPARVWAVMADCEEQDEFVPRVRFSEVRDRDEDGHTCELVFDLPFPLEDTRAVSHNRVRRLPDGGYQRRWELAPGEWSYRRNRGSWSVHPHGQARSLLINRMDVLPRSALPVWLLRAAQTRQAPQTFQAIRERVRSRAAPGGEGGGRGATAP